MEILNMKKSKLKEIFDICDLDELDSMDLLLGYVKKYDLELINSVFKKTYQQKWNKYSHEFEGMNEYDHITRINNFDIEKTFDSIELSSYELVFFKKIMEDALINIKNNENPLDLKLVPNIEKSLQNVSERLNDLGDLSELRDLNVLDSYDYPDEYSSNDLDKLYESNEKITEEELEAMFKKFNVIEIEEFESIFERIETYNIEKIMDISNKVKNEKMNNASKNFEVFVRPYNYNISSLYSKKDMLNEKELKLLCILFKDSILNCEENDDFNASLSNLMESFMEELDKRKKITENSSKRASFIKRIRVTPEKLENNRRYQKEEQKSNKNKQKENNIEK